VVQERLGGDDLEIWASPTVVPVAAGEEVPPSRPQGASSREAASRTRVRATRAVTRAGLARAT